MRIDPQIFEMPKDLEVDPELRAIHDMNDRLVRQLIKQNVQRQEDQLKGQVKEMSVVHVTKEGEPIFVAAMSDVDLLDAIRNFAQPLIEVNAKIDQVDVPRSRLSKLSYGEPEKIDPEKYRSLLNLTQLKVAPYVIEASLRNIPGLRDVLIQIFAGRKDRDDSAPKPNRSSMTSQQVNLVRSIARRKEGDRMLPSAAWVGQDGISVPDQNVVIIDGKFSVVDE